MCVELTNGVVHLVDCAAHLAKFSTFYQMRSASYQMLVHFVKCCALDHMLHFSSTDEMHSTFGQMRCAFGQMCRLMKCALTITVMNKLQNSQRAINAVT